MPQFAAVLRSIGLPQHAAYISIHLGHARQCAVPHGIAMQAAQRTTSAVSEP